MDAAIERNRVALARIVASLVAMAGLALDPEARGPGRTLPRHLWRAVLRLLRPAEAAARRLIIAAARGLVVPVPCARMLKPKPESPEPLLRRLGIAIVVPPADLARASLLRRPHVRETEAGGGGSDPSTPHIPPFALLDPLRRPIPEGHGHASGRAVPRILFPGLIEPSPLLPPPSPDDPVSAAGVGRRLAALAAALDDLPRHARRFARWKAARDASKASDDYAPGRFRRISPLRGGPPPGGRLARWNSACRDAAAARGRPGSIRDIDEILAHAHELAVDALECPDTS